MNTLKLTTLTMLIPLGWAVSVDSHPQSNEGSVSTLTPAPTLTCQIAQPHNSAAYLQNELASAVVDALEAVRTCDSTADFHETRNPVRGTFGLELYSIDVD